MKLLRVRFDTKEINSILGNAVSYSYGFLEGTEIQQIDLNRRLGEFTKEALYKYIDSQARMSPESLHHIYEWNQVGSPNSRLYSFNVIASKRVIKFEGKFLKSTSVNDSSSEPFVNKAEVMENGISVVVTPNQSDVLAFEVDGDTVFTTNSIYIAHPGGDEVAGSFGRVVEDFFNGFFTSAILSPFIKSLSYAKPYSDNFVSGTKGGKPVGIKAGIKYINTAGASVE